METIIAIIVVAIYVTIAIAVIVLVATYITIAIAVVVVVAIYITIATVVINRMGKESVQDIADRCKDRV